MADQWVCQTHIAEQKRVEAFCKDCRSPLCMGCILTNQHTSHEILSLQEASQELVSQVQERFSQEFEAGKSAIEKLTKAVDLKL